VIQNAKDRCFSHILPTKYLNALSEKAGEKAAEALNSKRRLNDLDIRFHIIDSHEGYVQILNIAGPAVEDVASPKVAAELAKLRMTRWPNWSINTRIDLWRQ